MTTVEPRGMTPAEAAETLVRTLTDRAGGEEFQLVVTDEDGQPIGDPITVVPSAV